MSKSTEQFMVCSFFPEWAWYFLYSTICCSPWSCHLLLASLHILPLDPFAFFFHPTTALPIFGWAAVKCLLSKMTWEAQRAWNRVNWMDGADEKRMVKGEEQWSAWATRRTMESGCRLTFRTTVRYAECQFSCLAAFPEGVPGCKWSGGDQGGEVEGKFSTVIDESAEKMLLVFVFCFFLVCLFLHSPWQLFAIECYKQAKVACQFLTGALIPAKRNRELEMCRHSERSGDVMLPELQFHFDVPFC